MHHPPFSASSIMGVAAGCDRAPRTHGEGLHAAGSSIIVSGHEHSYWRPCSVAGRRPRHAGHRRRRGSALPDSAPQSGRLFAEYRVAGSDQAENVFTAETFNFVHMRLWFGGGGFYAYSVDQKSKSTMIDRATST